MQNLLQIIRSTPQQQQPQYHNSMPAPRYNQPVNNGNMMNPGNFSNRMPQMHNMNVGMQMVNPQGQPQGQPRYIQPPGQIHPGSSPQFQNRPMSAPINAPMGAMPNMNATPMNRLPAPNQNNGYMQNNVYQQGPMQGMYGQNQAPVYGYPQQQVDSNHPRDPNGAASGGQGYS